MREVHQEVGLVFFLVVHGETFFKELSPLDSRSLFSSLEKAVSFHTPGGTIFLFKTVNK